MMKKPQNSYINQDSHSLAADSECNSDDSDSSTGSGRPPNFVRSNSAGTNSVLSATSHAITTQQTNWTSAAPTTPSSKSRDKLQAWVVVEGLRDSVQFAEDGSDRPNRVDGFLRKRRKWPMKGWHKRFFVLEKGLLSYAKSPNQISKGRYHGQVDLGFSVVSYKEKCGRIDIDADTIVHHIKIKNSELFQSWLTALTQHRLYRQWDITKGTGAMLLHLSSDKAADETVICDDFLDCVTDITMQPESGNEKCSDETNKQLLSQAGVVKSLSPSPTQEGPRSRSLSPDVVKTMTLTRDQQRGSIFSKQGSLRAGSNRMLAWLIDGSNVERFQRDLSDINSKILDLSETLEKLKSECTPRPVSLTQSNSNPNLLLKEAPISSTVKQQQATGSVLAQSFCSDRASMPPLILTSTNDLSATNSPGSPPIQSAPPFKHTDSDIHNRPSSDIWTPHQDFINSSSQILENLRRVLRGLTSEKDKLRQAIEKGPPSSIFSPGTATPNSAHTEQQIQSLQNLLNESNRQNADLKSRLMRIRQDTDLPPSSFTPLIRPGTPGMVASASQLEDVKSAALRSKSISTESVSERFFDTEDHFASEAASTSGSESDDDDVCDESDNEEIISLEGDTIRVHNKSGRGENIPMMEAKTGRREKLPATQPDLSNFSLMNLLCKNIGRDLSRLRLPVILNEPLSALQRLCEELEYSELLDIAAQMDDPVERMVYVAAFAVSGYASSFHRSGTKPFNPLLHETFEYKREDKGWKFASEQVSHHPPISACHCQSDNWTYWQELRLKNKFWGKSIEAVPIGAINLVISRYQEHYQWKKVTSCVHNIFSNPPQRYIDHYGEMVIQAPSATCRLTFHKANSWLGRRYEVSGSVIGKDGRKRQVFGKWNEGFYSGEAATAKCIWRPGVMPEDHEIYYGFTRFAIELNDLDLHSERHLLPVTDTRFRPDQRFLEEGRIDEAEAEKVRLENLQRAHTHDKEDQLNPNWFKKTPNAGDISYEFSGLYWKVRESPGFRKYPLPKLW